MLQILFKSQFDHPLTAIVKFLKKKYKKVYNKLWNKRLRDYLITMLLSKKTTENQDIYMNKINIIR